MKLVIFYWNYVLQENAELAVREMLTEIALKTKVWTLLFLSVKAASFGLQCKEKQQFFSSGLPFEWLRFLSITNGDSVSWLVTYELSKMV